MSKRPDSIGSWSGPLDCENQEVIHKQCLEQAGEGEEGRRRRERGRESEGRRRKKGRRRGEGGPA